jgi:general secretion pathway protein D
MTTSTNKSLSAIFAICCALLLGSLSSSEWTLPAQVRPPSSESEKKQALETLKKQVQQNQKDAVIAQQAQANPTPIPPPAASPSSALAQAPAPVAIPAQAPLQPPPVVDKGVKYNFDGLDLNEFINIVVDELKIGPIIIDPEIKGNVTIIGPTPITKDDLFPLFNLILKNNNAALIKQKNFYQIVPISSAIKKGVEIIEQMPETPSKPGSDKPSSEKPAGDKPFSKTSELKPSGSILADLKALAASERAKRSPATSIDNPSAPRLVTYVIRAEFVPISDLIEPIKLFMTDGGVVLTYPRLNMLILTDYTDSAAKIMQIIRMLDNNYLDPDLIELVKINNNSPGDIIEDLKKIFGGGKDGASGISFISLERLNSIFLVASSKRALNEVKSWIEKLDAASARNIQTHFYIVQNSTASNIATMLSALYGGEGSSGPEGQSTSATAGSGAIGGGRNQSGRTQQSSPFGNTGQINNITSQGAFGGIGQGGGAMGSGLSGMGQQLGPQLSVQPTISSQVLRGGTFSGLQDSVHMVVDDINNTLIIQSTAVDYAYLFETIKKMDVLPRQALIDARVFEVDLTNNYDFGVTSALQLASQDAATHSTGAAIAAGGVTANTFSFVGNTREIIMKLQALHSKTKVKVLESPSVLALDGSTASINVGGEIPYPAGGYVTSGGSSTSINYRKIGVTLMVNPKISASGSVTLSITQEVSAQGGDVNVGGTSATSFTVTSVSSTFTVRDGETVAIAGLIRESKDYGRTGVPFLSEIPLLGSLFGQSSRHVTRNELIILITPHVIRTVERLQEMTQELKDSLRSVRKLAYDHDQERIQDMEDARKERYGQEQKELNQVKPVKKTKPAKTEKPAKSEKAEELKKSEAPPKSEEPPKPEELKKPEEPKKAAESPKPN